MTLTKHPSDLRNQGVPGNEWMAQSERITATDQSELLVGGFIKIDSAGATCAVTMAAIGTGDAEILIGSTFCISTESVAGGNHTLTLPTGCLFDGVGAADVATFDAAFETLIFKIVSATRADVLANPAGITFS